MKLREVQAILAAEVFTGADKLDLEVEAGFGSDLMSDVLAFARDRVLLLTGLLNTHVIHTAAMIDAAAVVFVRGKRPDQALVEAAAALGLPLLGTRLLMYDSCGRLFRAGLKGCSGEFPEGNGAHNEGERNYPAAGIAACDRFPEKEAPAGEGPQRETVSEEMAPRRMPAGVIMTAGGGDRGAPGRKAPTRRRRSPSPAAWPVVTGGQA